MTYSVTDVNIYGRITVCPVISNLFDCVNMNLICLLVTFSLASKQTGDALYQQTSLHVPLSGEALQ